VRQAMLSEDQASMDRADIIARVFHLKKKQLMREIFNDGIFGKCLARVWTIEYQKRGLPHLHLLIFFDILGGLRPLS
jgi:helitron helicase-like protein